MIKCYEGRTENDVRMLGIRYLCGSDDWHGAPKGAYDWGRPICTDEQYNTARWILTDAIGAPPDPPLAFSFAHCFLAELGRADWLIPLDAVLAFAGKYEEGRGYEDVDG